jgi:hypothetical protein
MLTLMPDQDLSEISPIIDRKRFGKRMKSARKDTDFGRMTDLADELESRFEFSTSSQTLYTYENGRTIPPLEVLAMITAILRPDEGLRHFAPAFRKDLRTALFGGERWEDDPLGRSGRQAEAAGG